ncbi:hypothetical protein AsFPU1_1698 [Aphanothece sacrum FPU1]|uniref:Uncharacterized protein n=1 Tax=Aphanothece sacrum FPU1 TaxID=1920663 RepID=A0A401IG76_APHSA|nr:hypothetical protein AsFPU1_1698 [Aphanothece sacrum FPU1]
MGIWQYSTHPEWLGHISSQISDSTLPNTNINPDINGEVGNNLDIGVNFQDLTQNPTSDILSPRLNKIQSPSTNPLETLKTRNLLNPLTPGSTPSDSTTTTDNKPQIFQPLLPHLKNPNSLFPSLSSPPPPSKPITLSTLKPLDLAAMKDNPLNKALESLLSQDLARPQTNASGEQSRQTSGNSGDSSDNRPVQRPFNPSTPRPSVNPSYQPSYPTSGIPSNQQPYTNSYPYSASQGQPYQQPPYQQPYQQTPYQQPYPNPYVASPVQPYTNPYGSGTPVYQQPYQPNPSNNYNNQNPVNPTNQNPNQIKYGIQRPQIP